MPMEHNLTGLYDSFRKHGPAQVSESDLAI
jgi:hypothetical protein